MSQETERIPPDIKLLGETVVALNISCRTAGIYPRNHPAVDLSLNRAFDLFQNIFEGRLGLTLGVGKDTLIIDNYCLDRKNASYRQFAGLLNKLNIAYVTFLKDFTKDELYVFQDFVSEQAQDLSPDSILEVLNNQTLPHIQIGFVDYKGFSIEEGKTVQEIPQEDIWEQYVVGLMSGTLNAEEIEKIDEISADMFSRIINKMHEESPDKEATQRIFTLYVQRLLQRPFSNDGMKKLLDFLNGLQPDPRGQFLAVVVNVLSKNITVAARSLNNVSPDLAITLFHAMESQEISIPGNLRNLLDKLLRPAHEENDPLNLRGSCSVDDIFLPSDMLDILSKSELEKTIFDPFETSVSDAYQREIQKLSDFSAPERFTIPVARLKKDCDDDAIDKMFHLIIFEIMTSDAVSEEEYRQFIQTLREQTSQFMLTGQYGQVLQIVRLLRFNIERNRFADITSEAVKHYYTGEFFLAFIDSFKIIGSQARDEAWKFCEFFGDMIVPYLMNALVNEDSKTFRSLLMGFLKQFGETIVPDALRGLNDTRWFVKRNMLSLLIGCKSEEIIPHVRPYCRHENKKVSLEAIKCLLSLHDDYAFEVLSKYLRSGSEEDVQHAIFLIGSFRVKKAVVDLVQILEEKGTIKTDLTQKLLIIPALGNIGDPGCLEAFRKTLSAKSLFFKKDREKMKEEIYKTLKNFSYKDIEDMVQLGLKSKNRYIKEESLRLTRKGDR
jgi:hypothetical protein